uniref:Uncharacterized protein n=1 Tax=Arundo donax TaxID=35708 RepID=A0A0A9C3A8_ARUDO
MPHFLISSKWATASFPSPYCANAVSIVFQVTRSF